MNYSGSHLRKSVSSVDNKPSALRDYSILLTDIKTRIRTSQIRAALSANAEMISMYWDIGRMIHLRQKKEGWGSAIIPNLSRDIRNDLPEIKGFSERNIGYMIRFAKEYPLLSILQQPVAKLQNGTTSVIVPQPAAKLTGTEKLSQLLLKGSIPHAEPPVGLFSHIKSSKLSKLRI